MRSKVIGMIAYTGTVIGIGGIAGAIETGTSPVSAVVAFAIGAGLMILEERRTRNNGKKSDFLPVCDRDPAPLTITVRSQPVAYRSGGGYAQSSASGWA